MDASPRDIGSRLELFVDEWLIDEMDGVALKMHKPVPREVVMEYDRPWEGPVSMPGGVMVDDGKFKTWYGARSSGGASGQSQDSHTAYAESEDGIHWERPAWASRRSAGRAATTSYASSTRTTPTWGASTSTKGPAWGTTR